MAEPRIAFVRMAPTPIPNRLLPAQLEACFPDGVLETFDVEAQVRRDWLTMVVNPVYVLFENGWNLLRGRIGPWSAFFTTTWMFRRMSRLARRWIEHGDFAISLQIQSLFDARTPGTPHFVYTDHTHLANLQYPDFDQRALRGPRWLDLERALYANASTVFTRSSNISRSLEEQYGCPVQRVVRVGAGSNARVPRRQIDFDERHGSEILFVGVDWERKGGPDLIDAFKIVFSANPQARLTIVGCTPEVHVPNVQVLGRCPVEEIHRHYEAASIFCMPTRREPFGVAFVEALHHGLPIVATRIGAIPDLVQHGENGFLVEVGDVSALARYLAELLTDADLRRQMGERGSRRARDYTWESVAERMADLIRPALERSQSSLPRETPVSTPATRASS